MENRMKMCIKPVAPPFEPSSGWEFYHDYLNVYYLLLSSALVAWKHSPYTLLYIGAALQRTNVGACRLVTHLKALLLFVDRGFSIRGLFHVHHVNQYVKDHVQTNQADASHYTFNISPFALWDLKDLINCGYGRTRTSITFSKSCTSIPLFMLHTLFNNLRSSRVAGLSSLSVSELPTPGYL